MTVKTVTQLRLDVADAFRAANPHDTVLGTRLNTVLTDILDSMESLYASSTLHISGAGVPVNYTDGDPPASGQGVTPAGALYSDTTNGLVYRNEGSLAEPAWQALADAP